MKCTRCGSCDTWREDKLSAGLHRELWCCGSCGRRFSQEIATMQPAVREAVKIVTQPKPKKKREQEAKRAIYVLTFLVCPVCSTEMGSTLGFWRCHKCGCQIPDVPFVIEERSKREPPA